MKLAEIVAAIQGEFGTRNQVSQSGILQLVNQIQQIAFSADKKAFLVYDQFLQVATLAKVDPKGPYDFPTDPPVRKFLGVSVVRPEQILGIKQPMYQFQMMDPSYYVVGDPAYYPNGNPPQVIPVDPRNLYTSTLTDIFAKQFTFSATPRVADDYYRLVYYRRPKTIRSVTDDDRVMIPEEFHHTLLVQGAVALADFGIYGTKTPQQAIEVYLQSWWDYVDGTTDPNQSNSVSEGIPGL